MPELRKDPVTGRWVIISTDRTKRPTDFRKLAEILSAAHYRGYVVLEYEEQEDPRQACPRYVEEMRSAFGA